MENSEEVDVTDQEGGPSSEGVEQPKSVEEQEKPIPMEIDQSSSEEEEERYEAKTKVESHEDDEEEAQVRICRFFNGKRGCNKGEDCDFLHVLKPVKPNRAGQKVCRFWKTKEGCNKGDECTFLHSDVAPKAKNKPGPRRVVNECRFWKTQDGCVHGEKCKYRHSDDPAARSAYEENMECFNCRERGHHIRDCPKNCDSCGQHHPGRRCIRCHECKGLGHRAQDCIYARCKWCNDYHRSRDCPYMLSSS